MSRLDSEPLTVRQLGAIHREFGRLGFGPADRDRRLAAAAALTGLDTLGSLTHLTMGQAGLLVQVLASCQSPAALRRRWRQASAARVGGR